MKQTILITGGLGYIGSHTVVVLLQAGYKIIIVDNCSNSTINILDKIEAITTVRPVFYQGDINNAELLQTIFAEQNIDAVIHFAAKKAVGESMQIPFEYYENNVTGTQTLLRMMDKHQVRSLVFSSTCATYNAINLPPYTEDMSTKPESVYGLTKRIDEELIEGLTLTKKLSACILRYFNPIGNHPSGHIGENPTQQPQNIMPIIMEVLEKKRESLSIFGNTYNTPDGTCIRDYIHVMDLAEAHVKAVERLLIENGKSIIKNLGVYEIINLGTGRGTSVIEMVTAVQESLGVSLPYTIVDARIGDLPTVYGDCSKAKQLLGRETKRSIAEGIRDTWKFRQKNAF